MVTTQGWYPDPWQEHEHRWWDGARWTDWVLDPSAAQAAARPTAEGPGGAAGGPGAIAAFLDREVAAGAISSSVHRRLMADLLGRPHGAPALQYPPPGTAPAAPAAPSAPASVDLLEHPPVATPRAATTDLPVQPPARPLPPPPSLRPLPPPPSARRLPPPPDRALPPPPARQSWSGAPAPRSRRRPPITTDLAVHGLAYAGVALVLTGVIGFVIFAFGDVGSGWRPLAELAIVTVLLGSGAFLRRRGAPYVGDALVLLGGLVTPILIVTAFVDGAPVPPDLSARALALVLTPVFLVVAGVFALAVRRRATSPLRYLVAPMVWWAAAAAGLVFVSGNPTGRDITTPAAGQWALVALAVTATTWAARRHPDAVLARPTQIVALVGAPLAEVVVLTAADAEGWPLLPVLLAGIGGVLTVEALALGRRAPAVAVQAALLVVTGAAAAPALGSGWAAAATAVALVALVEWSLRHEPDTVVITACLGGAGVASLATVSRPASSLSLAVVLLAWSGARAWRRPAALEVALPLVGLFGYPLLAAGAIGQLWGSGWAAVALAAAAAAAIPLARARSRVGDRTGTAWVLSMVAVATTIALAVATIRPLDHGALLLGGVALGLSALAVALLPGWPPQRLWATSALVATSAVELGAAGGVTLSTGAAIAAGAGLALVILGQVPRVHDDGHLAVIGHLVGLLAVVAALVAAGEGLGPSIQAADLVTGWSALAIVAGAVGWSVSTAVGERYGSRERNLWIRLVEVDPADTAWAVPGEEPRLGQLGSLVPPVASLVWWSVAVPSVALAAGWLGPDDPWLGVTVAAVGLLAVLGGRALVAVRPRLARSWAIGIWFAVAVVPLTTASWSALLVACLAVVAAAIASEPDLGNPATASAGWLASGLAAVAAAADLGLDRDRLYLVVFGWGASVLLGTLAFDDRQAGRRQATGPVIRRARLWPPFVIGGAATLFALAPVVTEPRWVVGWCAIAFAAVSFAAAGLLRRAWVSLLGWTAAVAGAVALSPSEIWARPWAFVVVAVVLLGAAEVAHRVTAPDGRHPVTDLVHRWDLPPFALAQAILVWALVAAAVHGWVPATWLAVAATWAVVGVRLRSGWWFLAAVPVALVGAGAAGPGWLTLALLLTTVAAAVEANRSEDARLVLQLTTGTAGTATFVSCAVWQAWDLEALTLAVATTAGVVLVLLALGVRAGRLQQDWLATLVTFPVGGLLVAVDLALDPDVPRSPARFVVAAGLAASGAAAGLLARPVGWWVLRETAAILLVAAAAMAGAAVVLSPTSVVAYSVTGSALAVLGGAVLHESGGRAWARPAVLAGLLLESIALGAAAAELPDRPLLVLALSCLGVELLGIGVVTRRAGWLAAAPVAFLAAWLAFASEALTGDAQWYTVPTALTVLVMVGVVRWSRRRDGVDPRLPELSVTELLAMALLVGPALVETISRSPGFGMLAAGLGIGLVVWGVATRVRRRAVGGAVTAAVALLLMIVPPLVDLVPPLEGSVPWILLAALGLAALLTAAFLEKGRQLVRQGIRSFRELTQDWE